MSDSEIDVEAIRRHLDDYTDYLANPPDDDAGPVLTVMLLAKASACAADVPALLALLAEKDREIADLKMHAFGLSGEVLEGMQEEARLRQQVEEAAELLRRWAEGHACDCDDSPTADSRAWLAGRDVQGTTEQGTAE